MERKFKIFVLQKIKKKHYLFLILFLFGIFLFLSSQHCQRRNSPDKFILITLDTQRADFVSAYSPQNASTPHVDDLAQKGTLFENCWSLIPITLPSHASIFFSEPPHRVKNYNNGQIIRAKRTRPSFVKIFKINGFTTAAFVSLGVLRSAFGLNEDFDIYRDDFPPGRWYLSAEEVNKNVFPWLEQNKDNKFFLWIHYSDPHEPYAPPYFPNDFKLFLNSKLITELCLSKYTTNEVDLNLKKGRNELRLEVENKYVENPDHFRARFDKLDFFPPPDQKDLKVDFSRGWFIRRDDNVFFFRTNSYIDIDNNANFQHLKLIFRGKPILPVEGSRENYKKEVEYMDGEIGKLWDKLKELNLVENTAILVVGDHGEGLGEYNSQFGDRHIGHIHFLYNVYMKVPLIIYNPFVSQKGMRKSEPVTLLDIAPTIIKLMGFKKLSSFQGRNILRLKRGENLAIYEETYRPESVRNRFALLHYPWHLLFTPEENKFELFDLRKDPEEKENTYQEKNLSAELIKFKSKLESFAREVLKGKEEIKIDKRTEEMMRALGYIR